MISAVIHQLEQIFAAIPLPLLEVWGRFSYILGFALMICAFAGITFKPHDQWGFGRQRQTWDTKAFVSMIITLLLIFASGATGSSLVLGPAVQTFESLKDLSVFLCLVLFGYPALVVTPFAYCLSDLIGGVPPGFILNWLPGYFITAGCFWAAHQLLGRDPDFWKLRTWRRYFCFVLLFMGIDPVMWGYLCSTQFTSSIAYRQITPALVFTMSLTWIIAPMGLMLALPLARRYGFFWAEIPLYIRERSFRHHTHRAEGIPLRLVLVLPFIALLLTMVSATAYLVLKSSEDTARKLASHLHEEIAQNINLQLNDYVKQRPDIHGASFFAGIRDLIRHSSINRQGQIFIVDNEGDTIAASNIGPHSIQGLAVEHFKARVGPLDQLAFAQQFIFDVVSSQQLSRESWMVQATPYFNQHGALHWVVFTAIPGAYYQEGVRIGNSQSAMVIAFALALSLLLAAKMSGLVIRPIARMARATQALAAGDLTQRVPGGKLEELQALSQAFNYMAGQLQDSFQRTKRSEELFRDLVETTPGIVWQADPRSFRIIFISQQVENILGFSVEACEAKDFWLDHVHADDRERALIFYKQCLSLHGAQAIEYRFHRQDGSVVWLRDTVKIIEKEGWTRYLHGVMIDISDRKEVEEALEIVNLKAETALELAKAGYWHLRLNERDWYTSSARAVEIFGDIPNEKFRYRVQEDWYENAVSADPATAKRTRDNLSDALAETVPVFDSIYAYRRPIDGRIVWIRALGKIFRNKQGVATDMFGVTQDITEFKKVQDEITGMNSLLEKRVAERTEKLKLATRKLIESSRKAGMAEVAIGVLHNIGNALTSVSIKVQNLHQDYLNDSAAQHLQDLVVFLKLKGDDLGEFICHDTRGRHILPYLDTINEEVSRELQAHRRLIAQLLKDLHLVSQLIAKQQSTAKFTGVVENVRIQECLDDVLSIQTYDCEKYKIQLERTLPPNLALSTDRYKLLQILSNLINNAIQAMFANEGPRILSLCVLDLSDSVEIQVKDNGIGISPEQMTHMFRYGYTTKQSGHGFGLHSCSIDARLLGGSLSCVSDGVGRGATFVLQLPKRTEGSPDDLETQTADFFSLPSYPSRGRSGSDQPLGAAE